MRKKVLCTILLVFALLVQLCSCASSVPKTHAAASNDESGAVQEEKKDTSENDVKEEEPLFTLTEDMPVILVDDENFKTETTIKEYVKQGLGIPVQVIALSKYGDEREAQISALRTEIMAGGGPDAFILTSGTEDKLWFDDGSTKIPFFKNPEKTMRSGIFLPLDDLIAQSELLNPEEHYEIIMDAGKTEEGQMILPLLYSCPAYFVYEKDLNDPDIELNTWDDYLHCDDVKVLDHVKRRFSERFGDQYTDFADYENETFLVAPETLKQDCKALYEIPQSAGGAIGAPDFEEVYSDFSLTQIRCESEAVSVLTVPNDTGGLTAKVTAYAAINRNTEYAEEVFRFIELLFCENVQTNRDEFSVGAKKYSIARPSEMMVGADGGIVTHKNAYMDEENALIAELNSKINSVRFASDIDRVMMNLCLDATVYAENPDDAYFEEIAEKAHSEIQMILAE